MNIRLKKLLNLLDKKERHQFGIILALSFFAALLEMIGLGILPIFVSFISNPETYLSDPKFSYIEPYTTKYSRENLAVLGAGVLLAFFAIKTIYMLFVYFFQAQFVKRVICSTGTNMFNRYICAPYTHHINSNNSDIIRNVTHSPQYFGAAVILPILQLLLNSSIIIGSILILIVYNPYVTISSLAIPGVVFLLFMKFIRKKTEYHGALLQDSLSQSLSIVNQGLGSFKETQVSGTQEYVTSRYLESIEGIGKSIEFRKFASTSVKPILEFFGMCTLAAIMGFSILSDGSLESALPNLILVSAVIVRILPSASQIMGNITSLKSYGRIVEDLSNDLENLHKLEETKNKPGKNKTSEIKSELMQVQSIELRNLQFKYENSDIAALQDVGLRIDAGQSLAIIGQSGSGKSTLIDTLLGLLTPTSGQIYINDHPLDTLLGQWRSKIGYIPQNIYLIDSTIRENVAFGVRPDLIDDNRVWDSLKMADIKDMVIQLPDRLDTHTGERGIKLSGGQCQRIGIARALYHNPEILILDEATSALDPSTESKVLDNLLKSKACSILIMVTHRHISATLCDRIISLDRGKIREESKHTI